MVENGCLRSIDRMRRGNFVNSLAFRCKALGSIFRPLEQALDQNRLRWLGHAYRKTTSLHGVLRGRRWLEVDLP